MKTAHPILARRGALALYLGVWGLASLLLALAGVRLGGVGWLQALALALPMGLAYAGLCLAAWWIYRRVPLRLLDVPRLAVTHTVAGGLATAAVVAAGRGWSSWLEELAGWSDLGARFRGQEPLWLALGAFLYLLAVAMHELAQLAAASRAAETRAFELRSRAREAELAAYQAQIDPHFLMNSLHSLSALCGNDPAAARRTALALADVFRGNLEAGRRDWHSLADELRLAERYLEVEAVRFGPRLTVELTADDAARACRVPPLLLQPLIENAVKHGVAQLVAGGTVRLAAVRRDDRLEITIENPCDPDRPGGRHGTGVQVGLANVRGRLLTLYGPRSRFAITETPDSFRVELALPARVQERV